MKLEISMTERDKRLLIFLSIFVLVVCFGYWGIRPSFKKIDEMNKKIEKNNKIVKMNEQKIAQLMDFQDANDELEQKIIGARENYFQIMTSDQVDEYFTDMALKHNLYVYSLDIRMPSEYCDLAPYQYSEKALNPVVEEEYDLSVDAEEESDSDEKTDDADKDEDAELEDAVFEESTLENGIYAVKVQMSLTGEAADISKLVSELSHNDKQMRVLYYKYSTKRKVVVEEESEAYDVVEEKAIDIEVELYMCEE